MAKIVRVKKFTDARGSLNVVEDHQVGFPIKRVFNIYNLDLNSQRGGHGHKKTIVAMSCISGSCDVFINDGEKKHVISLKDTTEYLVLEPHEWHRMYNFGPNTIIQVLASELFDVNDYVFEEPK